MFKKLALTAALAACFAPVAHAQNVSIYGRLNVTAERVKTDTSSQTVLNDNSSRIGFKGTEDIGKGLKAGFVIEHGFDATNGTQTGSAFWTRESTISLSSTEFGTVRLGRMAASEAYFASADYVSLHNHDTGTSSDAFYGLGYSIAIGKLLNAVSYTSPTVNGFRVDVQIAESNGVDRPLSLAANYDAGPIHAGLGYESFNGLKSVALRGLYEMGAFTFGAYIESNSGSNDIDAAGSLFNTDAKRTNVRVSAMYAAGASEFHANYGKAGKIGGQADTEADQYTLGYNYNLSKRTKVYGYFTEVKSDAKVASLYGDFNSFAVGLRHNF